MLTGSVPPGAIRPLLTKAPPSPLAQKPRSSRKRIVLIVNASYRPTTSISDEVRPACAKATEPDTRAPVLTRSGMLAMVWCVVQWPEPSR
ncbi:hypothetical protein D3C72_1752440 [compost metagenome]